MRHASGCRLVAAASGQLLPRMNCLPPLSCKVAAPPRSFKTPRAVSILCFRFLTSTPAPCAAAIFLPASRIPARNSLFDNFLEKTVKRMSRRVPYAFGKICSASAVSPYVVWGFRNPCCIPDWQPRPSRSRLVRCARTALSVRRNASANSLTVRSLPRSNRRILPRVLSSNRVRQPRFFTIYHKSEQE